MGQFHPRDRDMTKFMLSIEHNNLVESDYHSYRFATVLFGTTSSQFLLDSTIFKHLDSIGQDQRITDTVKGSLYIGNLQGTDNS